MSDFTAIQSVPPRRTDRPQTTPDYCQAVRTAAGAGEKIADYGVVHHRMGHAPPEGYVRIVAPAEEPFEHWSADLSVRAPARMTLGELQRRLAVKGQHLPVDGDDAMTVAEIIAHNVSGPLRLTHGTCKDLLLGLRYVDAAGTLITVGGRTVKNVAGYDVTRMMVGNLNTLGLIADANLRTAAIPGRVSSVELRGLDPASLDAKVTSLLTCDASPYEMEHEWTPKGGHVLYVSYAGTVAGCDAQVSALKDWLVASGLRGELQPTNGDYETARGARALRRSWRYGVSGHVRLIVPPALTGQTVVTLTALNPTPGQITSLPAHGVVDFGGAWSEEEAMVAARSLDHVLRPIGGIRIWHRRPEDSARIAPFAPEQPDWPMLRKIKQTMDPMDLFNPGRFL